MSTGAVRAISAAAPTAPAVGPAGAGPEEAGSQWEGPRGRIRLKGDVGSEMKTGVADSQWGAAHGCDVEVSKLSGKHAANRDA